MYQCGNKNEIIRKIREDNVSVSDASIDSGVSTKTIYSWMRAGVSNGSQNLVLEIRKLKKENEQLYAMLGKLLHSCSAQKVNLLAEAVPGFKRHFASFLRISRTSIYIPSTKQNVRDEEALSGLLAPMLTTQLWLSTAWIAPCLECP